MEDGGAILGPVLLIDPSLNIVPMKKRREKRLRKGVCSEVAAQKQILQVHLSRGGGGGQGPTPARL